MPRTDPTGRLWTDTQRATFSDYMKNKHRTDKTFARQALSGLERGRAGKRLPWPIGTPERRVYIKARNEFPRRFNDNQRNLAIKAVSEGYSWQDVLNLLKTRENLS